MLSNLGEVIKGCWGREKGCEEGQRSLPSLEEVTSKLRPKRQLRAGESQMGGREWEFQAEGIWNRQRQGGVLYISIILSISVWLKE